MHAPRSASASDPAIVTRGLGRDFADRLLGVRWADAGGPPQEHDGHWRPYASSTAASAFGSDSIGQ